MMTTYFFTAFTQQRLRGARGTLRSQVPLGWLGKLRQYRRHQAQYRHLEELPDYLLEDVGLTRSDIRRACRGSHSG